MTAKHCVTTREQWASVAYTGGYYSYESSHCRNQKLGAVLLFQHTGNCKILVGSSEVVFQQ